MAYDYMHTQIETSDKRLVLSLFSMDLFSSLHILDDLWISASFPILQFLIQVQFRSWASQWQSDSCWPSSEALDNAILLIEHLYTHCLSSSAEFSLGKNSSQTCIKGSCMTSTKTISWKYKQFFRTWPSLEWEQYVCLALSTFSSRQKRHMD